MEDKAAEEAEQADEAPAEMAETAPAKPPLQGMCVNRVASTHAFY